MQIGFDDLMAVLSASDSVYLANVGPGPGGPNDYWKVSIRNDRAYLNAVCSQDQRLTILPLLGRIG